MAGWYRRSPLPIRPLTRIKGGRPKPKPNRSDHLRWFPGPPGRFRVVRKPPGRQRYHPAGAEEIERFVGLIPSWEEISCDLDGVMLCAPWQEEYPDTEGLYGEHAIILFSWPRQPEERFRHSFTRQLPEVAGRLSLRERRKDRDYAVTWSPSQARAYVLLFVLLHEIGHHVDWLLCRRGRYARRGESFAEDWAADCRQRIWDCFLQAFGEIEPAAGQARGAGRLLHRD